MNIHTSDVPVDSETIAVAETPIADELEAEQADAEDDEFVDGGESNEESDADALDAQAPHEE